MKTLSLLFAVASALLAQPVRWAATTGDVTISAAYTATIQQPATGGALQSIDQVVVYCSVACTVTQAANGTAATTTAGTVAPILPAPLSVTLPLSFFTASNVGAGTAQGGALHIFAGDTKVLCLSSTCGTAGQVALPPGGGTAANYSITIGSISGTVNITFYGRSQQ